jgi:hypothetical protein
MFSGTGIVVQPRAPQVPWNDALTFEPHHLWRVRDEVYYCNLFILNDFIVLDPRDYDK